MLTGHAAFDVEDIRVIVGRSTDNTNGFRGIIDEVRFYNRALTAAEVLAHSRQVYLTGRQGAVGATGAAGRTGHAVRPASWVRRARPGQSGLATGPAR